MVFICPGKAWPGHPCKYILFVLVRFFASVREQIVENKFHWSCSYCYKIDSFPKESTHFKGALCSDKVVSSVSLVEAVLRQQGTTPHFTRITAQTTAEAKKTALAMRAIAVPVMPRNVQSNKFLRHFIVTTLLQSKCKRPTARKQEQLSSSPNHIHLLRKRKRRI